jgi:drug/metabolite transporter (DMT)-like permease
MGMLWGVSFSVAKIAMNAGGTPMGVAFWQAVIASILLLSYTLARGRPMPLGGEQIRFYIVIGLLGIAIPGVCFYLAAPHLPAGILAITVTLVPILTYGLALTFKLEQISWRRVTGIIFGACAILLLVAPESSLPSRSAVPWLLLACVSSLCYASENILLARWEITGLGPIRIACGMNIAAALILLPVAISNDALFLPKFPFGVIEWTVVGLGLITTIAYTMFVMTIERAGPLFASQVGYVVTLAGVFWGMLLFGESHSAWVWVSLLTMLAGLALVSPRKASEAA